MNHIMGTFILIHRLPNWKTYGFYSEDYSKDERGADVDGERPHRDVNKPACDEAFYGQAIIGTFFRDHIPK